MEEKSSIFDSEVMTSTVEDHDINDKASINRKALLLAQMMDSTASSLTEEQINDHLSNDSNSYTNNNVINTSLDFSDIDLGAGVGTEMDKAILDLRKWQDERQNNIERLLKEQEFEQNDEDLFHDSIINMDNMKNSCVDDKQNDDYLLNYNEKNKKILASLESLLDDKSSSSSSSSIKSSESKIQSVLEGQIRNIESLREKQGDSEYDLQTLRFNELESQIRANLTAKYLEQENGNLLLSQVESTELEENMCELESELRDYDNALKDLLARSEEKSPSPMSLSLDDKLPSNRGEK